MTFTRRGLIALSLALLPVPGRAETPPDLRADLRAEVLHGWYRLVLELVRHTATYSPPVASRAFAYVGVIAHEAQVGLVPGPVTLAGQLNGLAALPAPAPGLDAATVLNAALERAMSDFFGNTGPMGQRAMAAMTRDLGAKVAEGLAPEAVAAARAHGLAVAAHVFAWSQGDGGAVVENMGFPMQYQGPEGPEFWVPTNTQALQQAPLLPGWGGNRPFAVPVGQMCKAPAPPSFSTAPGSAFHDGAMEVYRTAQTLTEDQVRIARFWSDDPMLSPTPPGHWVSIVCQIAVRDQMPAERVAAALAVHGGGGGRCLHRLLAREIRPQPDPPRHLHQAPHRPEMGTAADHAALPRIPLGAFGAVGGGRGGADRVVRRRISPLTMPVARR
jgi:hypothetical protein